MPAKRKPLITDSCTVIVLSTQSSEKFRSFTSHAAAMFGAHIIQDQPNENMLPLACHEHIFLICDQMNNNLNTFFFIKQHLPKVKLHVCVVADEKPEINPLVRKQITTAFWVCSTLSITQISQYCRSHFKKLRQRINHIRKSQSEDVKSNGKAMKQLAFCQKFKQMIRQHFQQPDFKTTDMAHIMGSSVSTLERKCLQYFEKPPKWLLMDYRLEYARKLVLETTKPLSTIACSCGFSSASYFSVKFTEKFNVSASQMRIQYHKMAS